MGVIQSEELKITTPTITRNEIGYDWYKENRTYYPYIRLYYAEKPYIELFSQYTNSYNYSMGKVRIKAYNSGSIGSIATSDNSSGVLVSQGKDGNYSFLGPNCLILHDYEGSTGWRSYCDSSGYLCFVKM